MHYLHIKQIHLNHPGLQEIFLLKRDTRLGENHSYMIILNGPVSVIVY